MHTAWQRKQVQSWLVFGFVASATFLCLLPVCSKDEAAKKSNSKADVSGADLFKQYCSTCHVGGGNTAKPTKPIVGSGMLKSIALFQKYLENPPGHMPYYQSVVTDKKTIRKLFDYCRQLKKSEEV